MGIEIDHVFICCDVGGAEGDALVAAGLVEGSAHRHAGQGTANRRFFFRNAMLELLWVHDKREAHREPAWRTQLWERWDGRADEACPFGFCWRPGSDGAGEPPFPTWDYRPPYLPDEHRICVADDTTLREPMWFFIEFGRRPDSQPREAREPLDHGAGLRELTSVVLVAPDPDQWSDAGDAVRESGLITVVPGRDYCLELVFDGGKKGEQVDFRFDLPLILRW